MVTISQAYRAGRAILEQAQLESPSYDSLLLFASVFGIDTRAQLAIRGQEPADDGLVDHYLALCTERVSRPLQYILGSWPFDGLELRCGEGVLVPREDTAVLVDLACTALKGRCKPRILDLCAGTGAVSLALLNRIPDADAVCVELDEGALPYLSENASLYGGNRAHILRCDVLCPPPVELVNERFDAIVSNPPYIETAVIPTLSRDVLCEPAVALDGGEDGLLFYRAITRHWLGLLKPGGILAVEIGSEQAQAVCAIFTDSGLTDISVKKDLGENNRAIIGTYIG